VEIVATGLTFPTGVAFDDAGGVYVTEAGYSYGEVFTTPRLLRVEQAGRVRTIATGGGAPWNGLAHHQGAFYVAAGGVREGGRILRISPDGSIAPVVDGLPSVGDHHTNGPVIGPDGMLYFSVGTATNSGVVGLDNHEFGWLRRHPDFHDVPCKDVIVMGYNFVTANPLTPEEDDRAGTGAFSPFGSRTDSGQHIPGRVPCSGAILRVPPTGGAPELIAWGFRNPFGLAFSPRGRLFATENGFDDRGSRPVVGSADFLYEVSPGTWYGWPDFAGGAPIWRGEGAAAPPQLLAVHPNVPPRPAAVFGVHSSSNGIDFSRSAAFGHTGEAFVALFGDLQARAGRVEAPGGFRVVRVNVETGAVHTFAANQGGRSGPASRLGRGGLERPVSVRFDPRGEALYVVDFGVMKESGEATAPVPQTGVLWRIRRGDAAVDEG
jgi:glucose/arabinose dehydrogenase